MTVSSTFTSPGTSPGRLLFHLAWGTLALILVACPSAAPGDPPEHLREIGSKLASVGVKGEAARYYERYVEHADIPGEKRAAVGLALAKLQKEDGQLERALGTLYRVEQWAPGSPSAKDAAPLIVELLDRLGKDQAAQSALSSRSQLDPAKSGPKEGAVVATVEGQSFTTGDLDAAIDALPPQLQQQLQQPEQKRQFLQQFVAEELLYRKAQKRGLDKDAEVRRRFDALTRQQVVGRLLEEELASSMKPSESDLRNFYQANIDRFKGADGKTAPFEQVQSQVGQAYLMGRMQELSQKMLQDAASSQDVKLFPEAIGASAAPAPSAPIPSPAGPTAPAPAPAGGTP